MQHIYIHIPYCLKKCSYCDFVSFESPKGQVPDEYITALTSEILSCAERYHGSIIETIYLGGGTPGLLTSEQIEKIVNTIKKRFRLSVNLEFSLEINPEVVTKEKLRAFSQLGVNRVSLGVQSFSNSALKKLGRVHGAEKAIHAIEAIQEVFVNFSVDIMYGLPEQSLEGAITDIRQVVSFSPKHISWYELTYEKGTSIVDQYSEMDEDLVLEIYHQGKKELEAAGLKQYEISNYAAKGFECRHNLAYWQSKSYLGFGVAAHSYDKSLNKRWSNVTKIDKYLRGDYRACAESAEEIDKILMGLRLNKGIKKQRLGGKYMKIIESLKQEELLIENKMNICLTEKGRSLANQVILRFLN